MAANDEKPLVFGATVVGSADPPPPNLRTQPSHASSLSATLEKDAPVDSSNPYSAFYKHPDARRSLDAGALHAKSNVAICDQDLEAATGPPLSTTTTQQQLQQPKVSVDGRVKECTMWPSRATIMEQKRSRQRAQGCNLFRHLTSKQRLWVKIVIALLIVAGAVGLGLGISRAVGGSIWKGRGQSQQV